MDGPPGPGGEGRGVPNHVSSRPTGMRALCLSPGCLARFLVVPFWYPACLWELGSPWCLTRPGCEVKGLSAWSRLGLLFPLPALAFPLPTLASVLSGPHSRQAEPDSGQGPWDPQPSACRGRLVSGSSCSGCPWVPPAWASAARGVVANRGLVCPGTPSSLCPHVTRCPGCEVGGRPL